MPDSPTGRSFDTVVVRAALVFPGGVAPAMGPDTVRIPVRVVWRTVGASAGLTAATGAAGAQGMPGDGLGSFQAPPAPAPAFRVARPPSPVFPQVDPIATLRAITDALNRFAPSDHPSLPAGGPLPDQPAAEPVDYWTRDVDNRTARALGMSRDQLGDAVHRLKRGRLRGDGDLYIHIPSGTVLFNGEYIGNLHDE